MKRLFYLALSSAAAFGLISFGIDHDAMAQAARDFWGNPVRRGYQPPNLAYIRFVLIAVSGGAGFGLGWFLSPQAAGLRKVITVVALSVLGLTAVIDNGLLGWGLTPFVCLAAFMVGLGYWARGFVERLRETPTTMGSARWASLYDMMAAGLFRDDGFRLGTIPTAQGSEDLHYNGNRHMLTFAPTTWGKGTTMIVPNLLTYEGSVMVIDPKGENAMITAKHRAAMGQEVYVVDPWGICENTTSDADDTVIPARFNPLDWLVKGDVDLGDNAKLLADAIIMQMGENEQFWTEEAKALLLGVIFFVATDKDEQEQRHLGRVRDLLMLDGDALKTLFKRMLQSPHHIVRSTGARCLQKEEKLLSNVLASVQAQTHFLDSQRIRDSLSSSDFKFDDLKTKPMSIYLVLPSDRLDEYGRWLRLLIQQALTVNARNIETKPDKSVLFILDEMPALGKLSKVEQAFGLMAGYGMQIHGICQDFSQLKRIYGDGCETFISNAGMIQYFGSRDNMSAEYFSKLCGVTTVWNFSTAFARAVGVTRGKDTSHSSTSTTTDTATGTQRKLAFPDELMRLPKGKQLIFVDNLNPIMADKQPWFENEELKERGVNLYEKQNAEDTA